LAPLENAVNTTYAIAQHFWMDEWKLKTNLFRKTCDPVQAHVIKFHLNDARSALETHAG
jgi:hypothetical protein